MKVVRLPASWNSRAVIVTDVADPQSWFTPDELVVVHRFPRDKRRMEWMTSRIAEKVLRQRGARGAHVSFSHSGPYGAAAVDAHPVGIDVERVRAIPETAAHLFLTDEETAAMLRCTIAHAILHFWSAKEALWKQRGGAVPTLKRVPLHLRDTLASGLSFDGVETYADGELVAALTLPIS